MAESNGHPKGTDGSSRSDSSEALSLATLGIHADDPINSYNDVAPALHVSTTFRYPSDPDKLAREYERNILEAYPIGGPIKSDVHIYSRATNSNVSRLEMLLSSFLGAPSLAYASGVSAFFALLVYLKPKVVAIGAGYHGCYSVLKVYQKLTQCQIVDLFDPKSWEDLLGPGDVMHLETPVNPTGKAYNIQHFADEAHRRGALLTVDGTFAPPPLQNPIDFGADYVMHSGTKYFGGHSDMLCGVISISTKRERWEWSYYELFEERVYMGAVLGSLEGWLGVRSLRTLELRVTRQSENADQLVQFLLDCVDSNSSRDSTEKDEDRAKAVRTCIAKIEHASLQKDDMHWLKRQMPNGFGPVFAVTMTNEPTAKRFPSKLRLFHHATSVGGVESLIEWRSISDPKIDPKVLRLSIGIENIEDLKADIVQACQALIAEGSAPSC